MNLRDRVLSGESSGRVKAATRMKKLQFLKTFRATGRELHEECWKRETTRNAGVCAVRSSNLKMLDGTFFGGGGTRIN